MESSAKISHDISQAVGEFEREYMGLKPRSIDVDLHETHILVSLTGAVSPAERQSARDEAVKELVERLAAAAFEAVSGELEEQVARISGRRVVRSRISIDPVAGDAILTFQTETA